MLAEAEGGSKFSLVYLEEALEAWTSPVRQVFCPHQSMAKAVQLFTYMRENENLEGVCLTLSQVNKEAICENVI